MVKGKIRVLSLFSGYGTDNFALKRLVEQGIIDSYECVGYSDIDKYANQCFRQNHCCECDFNTKYGWKRELLPKELGDVKLINPNDLEDFDLLTGGFPCQAFSVAGKGLGELDPRGTLFYEIIRIAEIKKPRYMLLENVKGLTNKNHRPTFEKILSELARIGYKVHWKVLNTKDYGIPQNRERVWFVCFKEQSDYDKFKFPEKEELKMFIKDILEKQVDEKYYLSEKLQERFRKYLEDKDKIIRGRPKMPYENGHRELEYKEYTDICPILSQNCASGDQKNIVAMRSYPRTGTKEEDGERHQNIEPRDDGCSNSLTSVQKDNLVFTRNGYETNMSKPEIGEANRIYGTNGVSPPVKASQLKIYDNHRKDEIREYEDVSFTLSQAMGTGGNNVPMVQDVANCLKVGGIVTKPKYYYEKKNDNFAVNQGQLRRLTPKECFRLQGFLNDEVNMEGISDTQCYRLAGNGQSINVVEKIFKEMFK